MRLLVLAWGALLALTLVAPVIGVAQEATPTAETAVSDIARTDVRYLLPFTPDGLNPGLTATAEEEGVCGFPSAAALDRPDAWDCIGAAGQIYDPCFENPFLPPDEPGQVACVDSPFSTEVVVLTLTAPLERNKEAIDTGMSMAQAAGVSIEPWDLPWALELANGDQCTLLGGTLTEMAGQTVHYGCSDGGAILGETDRSQPVWTVSYLAEGEVASTHVPVTVAWSWASGAATWGAHVGALARSMPRKDMSVDEQRFDTWTRAFARPGSRRGLVRALVGGGTFLAIARRDHSDAVAHHGNAGPGDPCRTNGQCLGADAPLVCDWNGYGNGTHCCTYAGNRCGFDKACCGTALCIGGYCSSAGSANAGSGGFASANAQGGTIAIGDINSGGNVGNTISVGNTRGGVRVSGGTVSNTTDISASAGGGTAIADASGGSGNVSGGDWFPPGYAAGPGDPCQYTGQCTNSQSFLTCDYNASTDDYRCCGYQGDRCDWDGGCCGWLSCNDNGYCVS